MSNKPKIAISLNTAWNIQNFRLGLIEHWIKAGYEVVAIAPPDDFVKEIEATGCRFIPLKNLSRKGTNPLNDLQLAQEFYRIYKKEKVDIALHYTIKPNIYGTLGAAWAGTQSVASVTGLGYAFLSKGLVNRVVKKLYKYAFAKCDRIVFQNGDDRQLFVESGWVLGEKTQIVHGSGIDMVRFQPMKVERKIDKIVFLFIGRLLFDKGIREFMAAAEIVARKHKNTEFQILGNFDQGNPSAISKDYLDEWLKHKQMQYFGVTNDTKPFIAAADVIVLPSYREGLPRVNLEGMAMAKPLLSTEVTGCRDTVDDGENGYLVEVKSADSLAEGMEKMITIGKEKRAEMGKKGRIKALRQFDEQIIIQNYQEIIENLWKKKVQGNR